MSLLKELISPEVTKLEEERGEFFDSRMFDEQTVFYIGPGASVSDTHGEPSGDYIYFADLQGSGDYIEFVKDNRVLETLEMPEAGRVSRILPPTITKWAVACGAPDDEKLEHEVGLLTIAYMKEMKRVSESLEEDQSLSSKDAHVKFEKIFDRINDGLDYIGSALESGKTLNTLSKANELTDYFRLLQNEFEKFNKKILEFQMALGIAIDTE